MRSSQANHHMSKKKRRITLTGLGLPRIFKEALWAWWNDNALRLGASLSFYTLFAIAPVLLVAIWIAGLVFGTATVHAELVSQMEGLVGREGAQAVEALLEGASRRRSGVFATIVGSITFLLAATGAFLELQAALNAIWRVAPNPSANLSAYVFDRLRSFGIVVAIGMAAGVASRERRRLVLRDRRAVRAALPLSTGRQTPMAARGHGLGRHCRALLGR
jgi:uncharacterized BrkB/YihY/UPF0761 family membrane protein